jgi:hypothetical protein
MNSDLCMFLNMPVFGDDFQKVQYNKITENDN